MRRTPGRITPARHKGLLLTTVDGLLWVAALFAAAWLRFEFDLHAIDLVGMATITPLALVLSSALGYVTYVYRGRYLIGSVDEAVGLARTMSVAGVVVFGVNFAVDEPPVPRSVPLSAALIALSGALAVRLVVRGYHERRARPNPVSAVRTIVYDAGVRGQQLVRSMLSGADGNYRPVALLDDDPALRKARIAGVPVRGESRDLAAVVRATSADLLVVATAPTDPAALRRIVVAAADAGLAVKVLPPLDHLLSSTARPSDLRDLDMADLLGRPPVDTHVASVAGLLAGARVLVTGAGGSIGSELCRQIHKLGPAQLLMLDRDESALHAVQLSIHGRAKLDLPDIILADIRDAGVLREVFARRRPDVVFHAAALKHLAVLEQYPDEAWKTNVVGTQNVLDAALEAGVRCFVNISTDKAANPVSVLGRSKRIGERLVAHAARRTEGTYLSVRFGNVLGSRGSVLTTFAEQLAAGGPLTVTHPEVTRFLMTIPEAVQLVLQAAAIGRPGEALVLDMGTPVRIAELAKAFMAIAGQRARIVYTGLGRGEKLHEELFGAGERDHRPTHPAISHVEVPGLDPAVVAATGARLGPAAAMATLVSPSPVPLVAGAPAAVRSAAPAPMSAGERSREPVRGLVDVPAARVGERVEELVEAPGERSGGVLVEPRRS